MRRALGARAHEVAVTVVGKGLRVALVGAAGGGGGGALFGARLLEGLAFAVPPTDAVTFLTAATLTLAARRWRTVPSVRAPPVLPPTGWYGTERRRSPKTLPGDHRPE